MSLPNYLAKIKSAGVYRYVWDKSVVPPQQAETLRLLIGYSEKGPFNTPIYIETVSDFKTHYGNISKRLERRGVYFHRLAQQALSAGPILALNLKPFDKETVHSVGFNGSENAIITTVETTVKSLYDTNRFWKLDEDQLPAKLPSGDGNAFIKDKYVYITATDSKDKSCSILTVPVENESYKGITFRVWYNTIGEEMPEYLEPIADNDMSKYFAKIYVFRGEFTENVCKEGSVLGKYFSLTGVLKSEYKNVFGEVIDTADALASDPNSNFIGVYEGSILPYFKDANGNYISLDLKFNADYNNHKMLMKLNESILETATDLDGLLIMAENNSFTYLPGYVYESINKTSGNIYDDCVKMLNEKGIRTALTNRVDVEYHYIIDTFDTETSQSKGQLFALAKEKDNAFAIVNFPKMSKFVENGKKDSNGVFDLKETMKSYTMPGDSEGASFGAYYTQLTFSDGTVKSVIPSAAIVSNNFMDKWGARQPYYIVAGPIYGAMSYSGLVGPDYNFGRSDLDILEPKGINAIIYVPRLGTYINSNQTAKQIPVSGLSKVHIRELVIYLQNEVEHLLQSYQWELNTQALRDTIKAKADAICERILNNGGLYAYKNVCDETNNTPEVIDNEMIVLDTEIEPARGAGKMVHQLTIHKTGGLSSSVK